MKMNLGRLVDECLGSSSFGVREYNSVVWVEELKPGTVRKLDLAIGLCRELRRGL